VGALIWSPPSQIPVPTLPSPPPPPQGVHCGYCTAHVIPHPTNPGNQVISYAACCCHAPDAPAAPHGCLTSMPAMCCGPAAAAQPSPTSLTGKLLAPAAASSCAWRLVCSQQEDRHCMLRRWHRCHRQTRPSQEGVQEACQLNRQPQGTDTSNPEQQLKGLVMHHDM
jgi:hypothetical protein